MTVVVSAAGRRDRLLHLHQELDVRLRLLEVPQHDLEGLLRVEPGTKGIRPNGTVVNEGLARWTYEGRTGYGISEYLHQFDGEGRPVVPID